MKTATLLLFFCILFQIDLSDSLAFYYDKVGPPKSNEVHIAEVAIVMPLNKILLIKKGSDYCAIKFTDFWTGKTKEDLFAKYELYYNKDMNSNFSGSNLIVHSKTLSFPKPRGIGRFAFSFSHREIKCGNIKVEWSGEGSVHFYSEDQNQGDYGIELAPTKWSNISEINVLDKRLKWYRYDENRERVNIPVDKLW